MQIESAALLRIVRLTVMLAFGVMTGCGGGGGDTSVGAAPGPTNSAPAVQSSLKTNVRVLSAAELASVRSEAPGTVVMTAPVSVAVGDVLMTTQSALKVTGIDAPAADGSVAVHGTVPDLSDVFSALTISVTGYAPAPAEFVPAEGVTVGTEQGQRARRVDPAHKPTGIDCAHTRSFERHHEQPQGLAKDQSLAQP